MIVSSLSSFIWKSCRCFCVMPLVFASLLTTYPGICMASAVFALFPVVSWCIQVPRPLLLRDKLECNLYRAICLFIVVSAQCIFRCIQPKQALFFFAVAHSIGLNTCNTHSLLCFQNAYNCFCLDLVSQGIETSNADLYCSYRPSSKLT